MLLAPSDLYEKLEFNKILSILEDYCYGEPGKDRVKKISFQTTKFILERVLNEVDEFRIALDQNHMVPTGYYPDLKEEERMLSIEGFVLSESQLLNIATLLRQVNRLFQFFKQSKRELYPFLFDIIKPFDFADDLLAAVDKAIDEEGNIKPDASRELARIRSLQVSKRKELERVFRNIINQFKNKGWLKDTEESFRNGRRVLTVASEHKRKMRGIIHDESATGKTAYVEPESVIPINNDLFDLYNEEKREIYRILRDLSDRIRPYLKLLVAYREVLSRMDVIQAKAQLGRSFNGRRPKLVEGPFLGIKKAFHPLLLLKNNKEGKVTVPFDLSLLNENRILVLSGPNAGGKSICLKSVGLLQLMVQAGMLVPVNEDSEFGIFEQLFIDIGDQQSLEDELSTYSSRLHNMKVFLEKANDKTLILIDEFGSGTDPKIGGAIAEAMLKDLNAVKIFGVITTHYSNLKVYAFRQKGIVNGSMTFDKDNLAPTYQLQIGKPGSSYAFEIAQKSGLGKKIINYARKKTGANEKAMDELLVSLQKEKQELSEKLQEAVEKQKNLDRLIKAYEKMSKDLEVNRKRLKLEKKQHSLQDTARTNKELEKLIREIREEKNEQKAKALLAETKEKRKQLTVEVGTLNEDIYHKPRKKSKSDDREIVVGDYVRLLSGGDIAMVESIRKNNAVIVVNNLRMTVKVRDIRHADAPIHSPTKGKIQTDTVHSVASFVNKLDLRGMRRDEALKTLESFIDEALIANGSEVRIIHGKGDGILREAVKTKLREYNEITLIRHEEPEKGGDGVTVAELG
ncbi:MAG: Smr/MutS family protein [Bacteroidota bacterium]